MVESHRIDSSFSTAPFPDLWRASLASLRANVLPGIALWIVGIGVVATYYGVAGAREPFERIAELKARHGYAYSGLATALFGGLIPFLYLWWADQIPKGQRGAWAAFFVIYWAIRGMEVDLLYRLQADWFGDASDWRTIGKKVIVDQFVYCPFWSAWITAIFYGWRDVGFSWARLRPQLRRICLFGVPSVLLSIWIVWIPATAIIYALPLELQIPLFNLVLCFFVLLISVLSKNTVV